MLPMIDEASFQGLEWTPARLDAHGIKLVAVKATEGLDYANPFRADQVAAARHAGCTVMHYHVGHPELNAPEPEVSFFLARAAAMPGDLIALDCEPQFFTLPGGQPRAQWVGGWTADAHEATSATPVTYCADDQITDGSMEAVRGKLPLWLAWPGADPARPPAPARPWLVSFLQYGQRDGTDLDSAYFGTLADLGKLAIPGHRRPPHHAYVIVAEWTAVNPPWNSTLSGIADRERITLAALLALNPQITAPATIHPGQRVRVPDSGPPA